MGMMKREEGKKAGYKKGISFPEAKAGAAISARLVWEETVRLEQGGAVLPPHEDNRYRLVM